MKKSLFILISFVTSFSVFADTRGLSSDPKARNTALLVSSSHGLPGLEYDISNVSEMALTTGSGFSVEKVVNGKATVATIASELTKLADSSDAAATHLFYFTGHGGRGTILAEDRAMKIDEIRKALLQGRESWGPMARLTFIVDSCHSGSLIDPMRSLKPMGVLESSEVLGQEMVDEIVDALSPKRDESPLYHSLLAFVSARADETCLAGSKGSAFTVALKNAWNKAVEQKWTVKQLIDETGKGTKGSHPTARLVPAQIADEVLVP
ncbi:caspase family protein [bacterium]|nr:caspase family protein [bacterium]